MKKFLKRYVSALLCAVLIFTQIDPISVIYAKNVTKIVTGEDETDSENGLEKAGPSETGTTWSRDDEEKDKNDGDDLRTDDDFESDILDEDILDEDILDEDILNNMHDLTKASPSEATPSEANNTYGMEELLLQNTLAVQPQEVEGAVYYLEDVLVPRGEIEAYYGSQLKEPEAAIYYMIEDYMKYAEELYDGATGSSFWTQSFSVEFSGLDYEEYSDFAIDVGNELNIYSKMAWEAFSLDHPEYDLKCLSIKGEPYYRDSSAIVDDVKLYSGTILYDITFRIRSSGESTDHPSYIIHKYHELMDTAASLNLQRDTNFETVKAIHDYLCENTEYSADQEDWLTNTAYGAVLEKKANCNGYARAFKVLCDYYDIPCVIAAGSDLTSDCIGNTVIYNEDELRQHMWNLVQMEDGEWYGVVVDADARNSSDDYLLVGSETTLEEGGSSFGDSYYMYNFVLTYSNSFDNSGKTYHSLLTPELCEERYGDFSREITIENIALYSKENNLNSEVSELDYVAGNFYYQYNENVNVEDPSASTYGNRYYLYFTVEAKDEIENPENVDITITLPDGSSFLSDTVESTRVYNLAEDFDNREIWIEVFVIYSETVPQKNILDINYSITQNEEIINQGSKDFVSIDIHSFSNSITLELGEGNANYIEWNAEMFFGDPTAPNQKLALFSAYMSDMMESSDKSALRERIKKNLTALGFSNICYSGVSSSPLWEEYVFAQKKVIYDGKVKTIFLSAIQGSDIALSLQTAYDWIGNLWYFGNDRHANIMVCAKNHLMELEQYCSAFGINLTDPELSGLITGHSRGGGVAFMTAAALNTKYGSYQEPLKNFSCYTFAALNVIPKSTNDLKKHGNIFNIVNFTDLVPFIPGHDLGKFGHSGVFNTLDNSSIEFIGTVRRLSMQKLHYLIPAITYALLERNFMIDVGAQHSMTKYEEAVKGNDFERLLWNFDDLAEQIDNIYDSEYLVEKMETIYATLDVITFPSRIAWSHLLFVPDRIMRWIIECPVDIDITDSKGEVVCRIENNQITYMRAEDISVVIVGDKKQILYPMDAGYQLQIAGYDAGTMDLKLILSDENGMDNIMYSFTNVPVAKNQVTMNATVANGDPEFRNAASEVIQPNSVQEAENFEYVTIQLDTDTEAMSAPGTNMYVKGDFVWAYTVGDGEETFIGWFDQDGNLISTKQFYVFTAEEPVHYTARFSSEGESYCDIYGHTIVIDEEVAPTATTTGLTQGSHCSVCGIVIEEQKVIPTLPQGESQDPSDGAETESGDEDGSSGESGNGNSGNSGNGSSSTGGGSSSGGGGGGGGGSSSVKPSAVQNISTPEYVVTGSWSQTAEGKWMFTSADNVIYKDMWAAVYNPYANVSAGQTNFDWFYFDENGYMVTGWFTDGGLVYYLNPVSDGTQGKMFTGWQFVDNKWYYFNEVSDGTKGSMKKDTWIGEYYVDPNGVWVE